MIHIGFRIEQTKIKGNYIVTPDATKIEVALMVYELKRAVHRLEEMTFAGEIVHGNRNQ